MRGSPVIVACRYDVAHGADLCNEHQRSSTRSSWDE